MGDKPFRIGPQPRTNTNEQRPVAAPPGGERVVRSQRTGDPLPDDSVKPYDPAIPWPASQATPSVFKAKP
jgi:hypothetical protein